MEAAAGWAKSLMMAGRTGEAVTAFESCLNRGSASPAVYSTAAGAALLAGDPQKAEHFCQSGLRRAPHDQACLALSGNRLAAAGGRAGRGPEPL